MGLSIVILAAGAGTRMRSDIPKVLHKISGKEMLYYSIREAKKISSDVKVVLFHKSETIKESMSRYFDGVEYVIQDHDRFPGTGGALKNIDFKHERVLILNGDMPLVEARELEVFANSTKDIAMSVIELKSGEGYGRVIIEDNSVKKVVEEKDADERTKKINLVNGGIYSIKKDILNRFLPLMNNNNAQKEYYLTDIIEFAKKSSLEIEPIFVKEENFKGVNSKADLADAEEIMQKRIKDRWLKEGISMRLPQTIYIEESVEFEGECFIESGVSILGSCKIEKSTIKSNSIVEDSTILNSSIGPMARVRPKSYIVDSHIGNFVEVKKAKLEGVKAGHLSYLGDCEIGRGSNVGAGTITCNYDGKHKHKTIIGEDVFIGSDTQFVAPVNIGNRVLIAAGTTVTKDVKSGALAVSRVEQKEIDGFYDRFFERK